MEQRLPIFPTRMNLSIVRTRIKSAMTGYWLLKRKSDALQKRHRELQAKLSNKNLDLANAFKDAYICLALAEYHGANVMMYVKQCSKRRVKVSASVEQTSGVTLPSYKLIKEDERPILFMERAGSVLSECRKKFIGVLEMLIDIATLHNSFKILDNVVKTTNRRVNALEFMVLPKLQNTEKYINSELDEQDREEFFKLKKIQKMEK
ncbi:V-type proton ATPase subunit D [Astathelohania contejeani]|uniref:V-type proton ATPase subunit D n=1 Tax=Astathelohania contejeani TaxID=164912 RepID=A0ABQ7HWI6_9MICR|nr:V-type proton ATPase subunit D [Thelohania contejeani]